MRAETSDLPPRELVVGLFELRTGEPIAAYRDPPRKYVQLADTPLIYIFLYDFGCEPHRRLLVRGPGATLREFGVDPAHAAFWDRYARLVGSMSLRDDGQPNGATGPKWSTPWIESRPGTYAGTQERAQEGSMEAQVS